ncbi:MAG TPA: DUF4870 domain-containing protein [Vicinamibacterales bacterium]|nr:DUF4870 domain-containing protein [Vicinamibacterales bacterium]
MPSDRLLSVLAYAGWWVTGLLLLMVERERAEVRFHAAQAAVALGAVWAVGLTCWALAFVLLSVTVTGFTLLLWTAWAVWAGGGLLWIACLVRAARGDRWRLPVAGRWAERVAARSRA